MTARTIALKNIGPSLDLDTRPTARPVREYTTVGADSVTAWYLQDAYSPDEYFTWSGERANDSTPREHEARFFTRQDAELFVEGHPALQLYKK